MARKIAQVLLKFRLAACINILGEVESLYLWKGALEKARERLMVVKTRRSHLKSLICLVRSHHSYDIPEIIALPIVNGDTPYLKWIWNETKPSSR